MENRHCQYCGKKLSSRRRRDARYCPSSRCRVGGYRQRVKRGTNPAQHRTKEMQPGLKSNDRIIRRWQSTGQPVSGDAHCQARAEAAAYEVIARRFEDLRFEAMTRQCAARSPYEVSEVVVGPTERIYLPRNARCVGLALIRADCGGGAVLVTATRPPYRFR